MDRVGKVAMLGTTNGASGLTLTGDEALAVVAGSNLGYVSGNLTSAIAVGDAVTLANRTEQLEVAGVAYDSDTLTTELTFTALFKDTDDLDGDITSKVWKDGDTVTTSGAFYSRRSCREIKSQYAAAQSGEYYITTYIAASQSFQRTLVHCEDRRASCRERV